MGKITSMYLTDEEVLELKKFCEENQCTQYSALKTALRELLSKPIREAEQETKTIVQNSEENEAKKNRQPEEPKPDSLTRLLKKLAKT